MYCAEIEIPDSLEILEMGEMPEERNSIPYRSVNVERGSTFLKNNGLIMKVPSALIPSEFDYLLNPRHESFHQLKVTDVRPMLLNSRLMK
ncbi:MAG: hypothetical protein JXR07_08750 [Reichenbachiella sp.]